jgi:O-antigen/teichoic acid export membrane protein
VNVTDDRVRRDESDGDSSGERFASGLAGRLVANASVHAVGTLLGAVVGFATFILVARRLGPSDYGDFVTGAAFLAIPVVIADLGLTTALTRTISAHPETTDDSVSSFVPVSAAIALLIVAMTVIVGVAAPLSQGAKTAIVLGAPGAFFAILSATLASVLRARLQLHKSVTPTLLGRLAALAVIGVAFWAGFGFKAAVLAIVAGSFVTFIGHVLVVRRLTAFRPTFERGRWWSVIRSSAAVGAAGALVQANQRLATILLSLLRAPRDVGLYGAGYRFVEVLHSTSGSVTVASFPALAHFAHSERSRFEAVQHASFNILAALAAPACLLLLIFPDDVLFYTAGAEYVAGEDILRILALVVPFAFANHILWWSLTALNDDRALLHAAVAAVCVTALIGVSLIPRHGAYAAAAATVAGESAVTLVTGFALSRRRALPSLGYLPSLTVATALAAAVAVSLPAPDLLKASASVVVYGAILAALPGTVQEMLGRAFHGINRVRAE